MAQNSKQSQCHNAPWLANSQTEMFSVYAGNARISCLIVTRCSGKLFHTRGPAALKFRAYRTW